MCGCFAGLFRAIARLFQAAPVDNRGLYERIMGANGPAAVPTPAQIIAFPLSPGGQFMTAQAFALLNHANVLGVTNTLHAQLGNWTWDPSSAGNSMAAGCTLLQGSRIAGECAVVAHALRVALIANNPYGVQQAAHNFTVRTYTGANGQGFIANHAPILNLDPNIYDPGTGNPVNRYLWQDHKTVEYNGRFYDACYDAEYLAQPAMAHAQILQSIPFTAATFANAFVLDVCITDNAAPLNARGFYIQCFYDGNQIAPNLAAVQGGGYRTVFVGPFVIGGANAAAQFGFDNTTDYLNGVVLH
ncbi:hypothetical protein ACFL12_00215 [Pseudomonadota bacterium]